MADVTVDRLVVLIDAQTRSFETQIKKLEGQIAASSKRMAGGFKELNKGILETGESLAFAFKGFIGFEVLRGLREMIKGVADLAKESERVGIPVEQFQALIGAARKANVEEGTMVSLLTQFNQRIGEASVKGGDLAKILAANNVPLVDANGNLRDTHALFLDIVSLMTNAKSIQEAQVIATAAFGRSYQEALGFLRGGTQAITDGEEATRAAGGVIDKELVQRAKEFDDRWVVAWANWSAEGKSAILSVMNFWEKWQAESGKTVVDKFERGATNAGKAQIDALEKEKAALEASIAEAERTGTNLPGTATPWELAGWKARLEEVNRELAEVRKQLEAVTGLNTKLATPFRGNAMGSGGMFGSKPAVIPDLGGDAEATAKKAAEANAKLRDILETLNKIGQSAWAEATIRDLDAIAAAGQQTIDALHDASKGLADDFQSFTDSVIDDFSSIEDAALSLAKTLTKQIINAELFGVGPFAGVFGTQGVQGAPGGVLGNLISSLVNRTAAPAASVAAPPSTGASGGIIGDLISSILGEAKPSLAPIPVTVKQIAPLPGTGSKIMGALVSGNESSDTLTGNAGTDLFNLLRSNKIQGRIPPTDEVFAPGEIMSHPGPGATYTQQTINPDVFGGSVGSDMLLSGNDANMAAKEFAGSVRGVADTANAAGRDFAPPFTSGLQKIVSAVSGAEPGTPGFDISSLIGKLTGGGFNFGGFGSYASTGSLFEHSVPFLAEGGRVSGPGSGKSDGILSMLSDGEFVVNADAAAKHRALLEKINASGSEIRLPKFAAGGPVEAIMPKLTAPSMPIPHFAAGGPVEMPAYRIPQAPAAIVSPVMRSNVVVKNYGSSRVETRERDGIDGRDIEILIDRHFAQNFSRAFRDTGREYGLKPTLTGRT